MLITDLQVGTAISFEITLGDSTYEFPSSVLSVGPDSIIIPPFSINGSIVDLADKKYGNLAFAIYYANLSEGKRYVFKSVSLETVDTTNRSIPDGYRITANGFASLAKISDRRNNQRLPLNVRGSVTLDGSNRNVGVTYNDISANGVSFFCSEDFNSYSTNICYVFLQDDINGHDFDLCVKCKIVRHVDNENNLLYGCSITESTQEYRFYITLKQSEARYANTHKIMPTVSSSVASIGRPSSSGAKFYTSDRSGKNGSYGYS